MYNLCICSFILFDCLNCLAQFSSTFYLVFDLFWVGKCAIWCSGLLLYSYFLLVTDYGKYKFSFGAVF